MFNAEEIRSFLIMNPFSCNNAQSCKYCSNLDISRYSTNFPSLKIQNNSNFESIASEKAMK